MQPIQIANYIKIENAVNFEIERLLVESKNKTKHLNDALDRLYLIIVQSFPELALTNRRFTAKQINPQEALTLKLRTIQDMLNAKISEWIPFNEDDNSFGYRGPAGTFTEQISLRQALNIASYNPLNPWGGTWGPLWGKSTALKNVEQRLNIDLPS